MLSKIEFNEKNFVFYSFIVITTWCAWFLSFGGIEAFSYINQYWQISITMIFGSIVAGGTSVGGGVVAFPVLTKAMQFSANDAKIFSLAIQSVGMTSASIMIVYMKLKLEWSVIRWASIGGSIGVVLGSIYLAPLLQPVITKTFFTALTSSFAFTLLILNRSNIDHYLRLPVVGLNEKTLVLIAGLAGGLVSGVVGSGIDIILFSVMVLLFRINEKVAVSTSVVIMAVISIVGFSVHFFILNDINQLVLNYWVAAVPMVVVGGPIGAIICSKLRNSTIVMILLILIFMEFLSTIMLLTFTLSIIMFSITAFMFFTFLYITMFKITRY